MSSNGGLSWQLLFMGRAFPAPVIEIDPTDPKTVYVGVGPSFIYHTSDRGQTWNLITPPPGHELLSLAIAQTNDSVLYAGFVYGGVFKSTDKGGSWLQLSFGFPLQAGPHLAVDPYNENIVYATIHSIDTTQPSGVFKSADGGLTWQEMNTGLGKKDQRIHSISINPKQENDLFISVSNNSGSLVFRSTNGGEQWFEFGNGLPKEVGGYAL